MLLLSMALASDSLNAGLQLAAVDAVGLAGAYAAGGSPALAGAGVGAVLTLAHYPDLQQRWEWGEYGVAGYHSLSQRVALSMFSGAAMTASQNPGAMRAAAPVFATNLVWVHAVALVGSSLPASNVSTAGLVLTGAAASALSGLGQSWSFTGRNNGLLCMESAMLMLASGAASGAMFGAYGAPVFVGTAGRF
jgi:hypothetical protein